MKLILTGTGSPYPCLERAGASQVVEVAGDLLLFDCGDCTTTQLLRAGICPEDIRDLFLTHLHVDHTHGLSQFVIGGWIRGRQALRVYGPGNTARLIDLLFKEAYREDLETRFVHGRSAKGVADLVVQLVKAGIVLERPRYRVTAAPAAHVLDTHGYRIDADGRSIVLTGDGTYSENIVRLACRTDILVHECFCSESARPPWLSQQYWDHIATYHSTPEQAGRTAREAGARRLVLTHVRPTVDPQELKSRCQTEFAGEVIVGEDLMQLEC